jgi:hypothetical protein
LTNESFLQNETGLPIKDGPLLIVHKDNMFFKKIKRITISFFNKGKLISLGLFFCFFVDFTIYVISTNLCWVVLMASNANLVTVRNLHFSEIEA